MGEVNNNDNTLNSSESAFIKQIYSLSVPIIKDFIYEIAKFENDEDILFKLSEFEVDVMGSIKIDYEKEDNTKMSYYIVLKICENDHNINLEFNKIKPHISENQWNHILKYVSCLVCIVRTIYASSYQNFDMGEKYKEILIDPETSTLYIPNFHKRIGIFIEDNIIETNSVEE